jgi:putative DNA primase/helicase
MPAGATADVLRNMLTEARELVDTATADRADADVDNYNDVTELERLATLSPVEYDRERKSAARALGIRAPTLDALVKRLRPAISAGQGSEVAFDEAEPWPYVVDGGALLAAIAGVFERHAALPAHAATALALWCLHAWAFEASFTTPRLAITSPQPRCGKTTVLRLVGAFVPRQLPTANATVSSLFRIVEKHRPTLLIDEADTFLSENLELRGLLNSGFQRDGTFLRNVGDDYEPRVFSTFSAVAIALIGRLPATLEDRSIKVPMRRAVLGEVTERFRPDRPPALVRTLRAQAARWSADNLEALHDSDPIMPSALHDRACDCWRPLVAIAELAGGEWPARARAAALALSGDGDGESLGVELLKDIRAIFARLGVDRIKSAELVEALTSDAERPWATIDKGRPLNQNKLARRLALFDVKTKNVRFTHGAISKAYALADFADAFARYLPIVSATPLQANEMNDLNRFASATNSLTVADQSGADGADSCDCSAVADPSIARAAAKKVVEL